MKYRLDWFVLLVCVVCSFTVGMTYSDLEWIEILNEVEAKECIF